MSARVPSTLQVSSAAVSSSCWRLAYADIFGMQGRSCTLFYKEHMILHLDTVPEGNKTLTQVPVLRHRMGVLL